LVDKNRIIVINGGPRRRRGTGVVDPKKKSYLQGDVVSGQVAAILGVDRPVEADDLIAALTQRRQGVVGALGKHHLGPVL
jgi:hypothetical protein